VLSVFCFWNIQFHEDMADFLSAQSPVPTFGLLVAGRPVMMFHQASATQCLTVLESPQQVKELSFFLMPGMSLPAGAGAALYFSQAPYTEWELVGAIGNCRQSGTWRAPWTGRLQDHSNNPIQLGASIESLDTLSNMDIASTGVEDRLEYAKKIAVNLFNYMTSFSSSAQPGVILVPTTAFDDWMEKFKRKFAIDQNFFLHA